MSQSSQEREDNEELELLNRQRHYPVVKHNDFIQKSRFSLSVQETKVILFLISKIKPDDTDFINQEFDIVEFCKVCHIDTDNGKNYRNLKDTIKHLSDKSEWVMIDDVTETIMRWINKAWINKGSGKIRIRLDDDMKPYLLDLHKNFTSYELIYTLPMRSQYSIRLYELLRSYEYKGRTITLELEGLKRILSAENHERYNNFKRKVLDIAIREINHFSDLAVSYEPVKVGRSYAKIKFIMKLKIELDERLRTMARIDEVLNPNQMSLFEKAYGMKP